MTIKIEIRANAVQAALNELIDKVGNLQEPLNEVGMYMERETRLNFARQSDPDGAPWAPLKPSTLRRKKSGTILRESGALAGSIAASPASGNSVRVRSSGIGYAIYHQTGTSKMTARPFIGISEGRHGPKIRQIFESFFNG